jgi:DNA (cytosine-5)-methyltransferase 3A
MVVKGKAYTLTASYSKATPSPAQVEHNIEKGQRTMVRIGQIGNGGQGGRIYSTDGKSVTLSAHGGGQGAKTGLYKVGRDIGRRLNENGHRADADTSIPYERRIETREDDKCGTLTSVAKDNLVVGERIRKLTPIECERLQGLPDNYTEGVATTNRYKCLGNAFNVDVVAHILGRIKLMY